MQRWQQRVVAAGSMLVLAGLSACGAPRGVAKPTPTGGGRLTESVGFWAKGAHASLAPASKYPHSITVFSPLWYTLNPTGGLRSHVDAAAARSAAALHWKAVPIVNLAGRPTFLASVTGRLAVAKSLSALVRTHHYAGINLDFEPAAVAYKTDLASFVTDLHDWLPPAGKGLYLDLVPASGGAYDYKAMTPNLTAYILMSYDQHDSGSAAGPVAATSWVTARLARILSVVPASHVDLGLAFYGYRWVAGTTKATTLPLNAIPPAVSAHAKYNAVDQEMTGTYTGTSGTRYVFWYESPQGLAAKVKLAQSKHLRGVGIWRLGYQTGPALALVQKAIGAAPAKGPAATAVKTPTAKKSSPSTTGTKPSASQTGSKPHKIATSRKKSASSTHS